MFPIVIQYFPMDKGISTKILDVYNDPKEDSEVIEKQIVASIERNGLTLNSISGYSADNTSVNYGRNIFVYEKLGNLVPGLTKADCKFHIVHNCTKHEWKAFSFDTEVLIVKVYSEFSAYVKRTE